MKTEEGAEGAEGELCVKKLIEQIVLDVAKLPDRNSPDNWPEAMLVTGDELSSILEHRLSALEGCVTELGANRALVVRNEYNAGFNAGLEFAMRKIRTYIEGKGLFQ